ncbi:hypothetical protein Dsin_012487 [Dipteronia sinensis]|uniref:CCHC-type domain-containing protein n=1 Tax=Dipteronia sinensis TaxID=43782 RepID=A0AAE0AJG2_9ROSI|nr:hypothetical protein Dsin_012487 [Dipteronia sinensis]
MTREIGIFLGKMIGEFWEIDVDPSGECVGKYIWVRAVINIDEPLHRILRVDVLGDGTELTMLMWYEKLPDHYFRCGRIGHVVRDCLEGAAGSGPEDFNLLFGPWLKVASPTKKNDFRQRYEDHESQSSWRGETNAGDHQNRKKRDNLALKGARNKERGHSVGGLTEMVGFPAIPVVEARKV